MKSKVIAISVLLALNTVAGNMPCDGIDKNSPGYQRCLAMNAQIYKLAQAQQKSQSQKDETYRQRKLGNWGGVVRSKPGQGTKLRSNRPGDVKLRQTPTHALSGRNSGFDGARAGGGPRTAYGKAVQKTKLYIKKFE